MKKYRPATGDTVQHRSFSRQPANDALLSGNSDSQSRSLCAVKGYRQVVERVQRVAGPPGYFEALLYSKVSQPAQQGHECDLQLDSGQTCAEAKMVPTAESEMSHGVAARDVEPMRINELPRIAIGGADADDQHRILCDLLAGELDVVGRASRRPLHGRVHAQQLFDGAADQ